jgi:hypothetical protein
MDNGKDRNVAPSHLSRRRFVQSSAAAALGAVTAGRLSARAYAAGDDEIKIALIGCGGRGTGAAVQALSTAGKVTLWAMADAFPDRLEASYKQLLKGGNISQSPGAESQAAKIDVPPERRFTGMDAYRKVVGLDQIEHDRLFDAIRNDRPHNEAVYGAESTMTAILGRMAAYSGKMVT